MIVDELKKSIIMSAITGNLTTQFQNELVSEELHDYKDELTFSLPENWKAVKLIDITDYGKNTSFVGSSLSNDSWILELEDIEKDSGVLLKKVYQKERKAVSNKNQFKKGDLLYGKLRPYLNKCIIAEEDGYCSTEIVPMTLNNDIINKYLQLVLMSPYFLNYVNKKSYGTKMPRLGTSDAQNSLIPLPPIDEQKRIISKVDELFEKLIDIKPIEDELFSLKNSFSISMVKSILEYAFSGKLINGVCSFEKWDDKELIKLADINTGNSISESIKKTKYMNLNEGYNYIGTKDLNFDHTFIYDNGVKIPFEEQGFKYANADDILMCIEGGSAGKKIGILSEKVCFGNKLCKFSILTDDLLPKFLYYYLQSPIFLKNFYENLSGIIGGVSINKIKKIHIKYPTVSEQQAIVDRIDSLLLLCSDIEKLVNEKK